MKLWHSQIEEQLIILCVATFLKSVKFTLYNQRALKKLYFIHTNVGRMKNM